MSDTLPPRYAEALLTSLGADESLTNDVLGDLAEEFVERTSWQTPREARGWYWRQALTVAPCLLRDWRRNVKAHDLGSVVIAWLWSTLALYLTGNTCVTLLERITFALTGVPLNAYFQHWVELGDPWWFAILVYGVLVTSTTIGGFIAGSIGKRAAVPMAMAVATLWTSTLAWRLGAAGLLSPTALRNDAVIFVATTAGGFLAAVTSRRSPPHQATGASF